MKLLTHTSTTALVTAGAVLSAVMMVATSAFAATGGGAPSSIDANYNKERAACLAGRTGQDQKTCLKEAVAARDEARRGHLKTASEQELANNALLRCQRVAEQDRQDCRDMVLGQGTRDGSVQSGGILKRIDRMVEENPTAAGAAASAPPAPPAPPVAPDQTPQRPKAPPHPLPPASASAR